MGKQPFRLPFLHLKADRSRRFGKGVSIWQGGGTHMNRKKHVIFTVDDETFSMPVEFVTKIIRLEAITDAPDLPDCVTGLIDLRDKQVPVVDMRLKLKKTPREYDERTEVIIVAFHELTFGLIVDRILEVSEVLDKAEEKPQIIKKEEINFMKYFSKTDLELEMLQDYKETRKRLIN